jgi:hypothetical protein
MEKPMTKNSRNYDNWRLVSTLTKVYDYLDDKLGQLRREVDETQSTSDELCLNEEIRNLIDKMLCEFSSLNQEATRVRRVTEQRLSEEYDEESERSRTPKKREAHVYADRPGEGGYTDWSGSRSSDEPNSREE